MKYKAFLSYKHPDDAQALAFVENFEASLKSYAKPTLSAPIKIFRDEVNLAPGADLNQLIRDALEESEFLLLLASRDAANSKWVDDEIRVWFDELKRPQESLIVVVLDGQIELKDTHEIDWARTDCLPPSAKEFIETIPLWIDFIGLTQVANIDLGHPGFKAGVNRIVARFRNLDPEIMIGAEILQHRKNRRLVFGSAAVLTVLMIATIVFAMLTQFQRQQAAVAWEHSMSRQLAAQSVYSIRNRANQLELSALLAVEAVQRSPTLQGNDALLSVLKLLRPLEFTVDHEAPIQGAAFDPTGTYLASVSASSDGGLLKVMRAGDDTLHFEHRIPDFLSSVVFSPNAKMLAVGAWSGNVRVFDTRTGSLLYEVSEPTELVRQTFVGSAFSADGKYLAVAVGEKLSLHEPNTGRYSTTYDLGAPIKDIEISTSSNHLMVGTSNGVVKIWNLANTNQHPVLLPHSEGLENVALGPYGDIAATVNMYGDITLWDVKDALVLGRWRTLQEVSAIKFSPDGGWLGAATGDRVDFSGRLRVWSVHDLVEIGTMPHQGPVTRLAFAPDSRTIASASLDDTARLWDVYSATELARMSHDNSVIALAFSPDGQLFASGGHDNRVDIWKVNDGAVARFPHATEVTSVSISSSGKYIASGSGGIDPAGFPGLVRLWDTNTGKLVFGRGHEASIKKVVFSPTDAWLAAIAEDSRLVRIWSIPGGDVIQEQLHEDDVVDFAFLPTSGSLVTADRSGRINKWSIGGEELEFNEHLGHPVSLFEASADGSLIAAAGGGSVFIIDAFSGRRVVKLYLNDTVEALAFSPNGKRLAVSEVGGAVWIWKTSDWQRLVTFPAGAPAIQLKFSADGKRLATRFGNNQIMVKVWDVETQTQLVGLPHEAEILAIDLDKTGRWVATASVDGTARVWSADTGAQLSRMDFSHLVSDITLDKSGRRVIAGSYDKTVTTWLWSGQDMILSVCERLRRNLSVDEWREFLLAEGYRKTCPDIQ